MPHTPPGSFYRQGIRLLLLPAACWVSACSSSSDPVPAPPVTPPAPPAVLPEHLTMGNPSGAMADEQQPTNFLLLKEQYALSYHQERAIPNWVSWHLVNEHRGSAARKDDFRPDNTLPAGWYQVQANSYTGSGFDRGHNCPSADWTATAADNSATFLMTNMMPQAPRNNQQTWANLENFSRDQLKGGSNEVYIICGSYGKGGTGSNGYAATLDQGRVTVPARIWKVLVILPVGDNDAARVNTSTRVIAVDTPNDNSLSTNWGQYRTTVDAIEAATGYDLLSAVAPAIQLQIESRIDDGSM